MLADSRPRPPVFQPFWQLKERRPSIETAVRLAFTGCALIPRDVHTHTNTWKHTLTDESTSKWGGDTEHDSDRVRNDTQLCVCDQEIAKHSGKNWKLIYLSFDTVGLSFSFTIIWYFWFCHFACWCRDGGHTNISHNPIKSWESVCVRLCVSYSTICGSDI